MVLLIGSWWGDKELRSDEVESKNLYSKFLGFQLESSTPVTKRPGNQVGVPAESRFVSDVTVHIGKFVVLCNITSRGYTDTSQITAAPYKFLAKNI